MLKRKIKAFSTVTLFIFLINQLSPSSLGLAAPPNTIQSEISLQIPYQINIPPDLGTVETLVNGQGLTIAHIQEAHGDRTAQKNIQKILHHLKDQYGFDLVLLEGSAFKLHPELARFYPDNMNLTMEILDDLLNQSIASGSELFLAKEKKAEGYGIEQAKAYRENSRAFVEVHRQKQKTGKFLSEMEIQIRRLSAPHLNKNLREFLEREAAFEANRLPLEDWLETLKSQAQKNLGLDLNHPANQIDWPMLLRIFKLQEFEQKIDMGAYEKEREKFLTVIAKRAKNIVIPAQAGIHRTMDPRLRGDDMLGYIETLLRLPLSHHDLPDPETELLFEKMVSLLPKDFNYKAYPNVNYFIGHLILQSELSAGGGSATNSGGKAYGLIAEIKTLTGQITDKLAVTEKEKRIVELLKKYRLLRKLFALELSPEEYESIKRHPERSEGSRDPSAVSRPQDDGKNEYRPSYLIQSFHSLNSDKRVRNSEFANIKSIDALYDKALEFYRWAKARDQIMLQNVEKRLKETGKSKAVVITGGFHSGPFREHLVEKGFNYALISPKISDKPNQENYIQSILKGYIEPAKVSTAAMNRVFQIETTRSEARQLAKDLGITAPRILQAVTHFRAAQGKSRSEIRQELSQMLYFLQFSRPHSESRLSSARAEGRSPSLSGEDFVALDPIETQKLKVKGVHNLSNLEGDAKFNQIVELNPAGILVRSKTKVTTEFLRALKNALGEKFRLKYVIRLGHGTDNVTFDRNEFSEIEVIKTLGSRISLAALAGRMMAVTEQEHFDPKVVVAQDESPDFFLPLQSFRDVSEKKIIAAPISEQARLRAKSAIILQPISLRALESLRSPASNPHVVGVLGAGDIGGLFIELARSLGLQVWVNTRSMEKDPSKQPKAEANYRFATKKEMYAYANYIVVFTGLTTSSEGETTEGLIGKDAVDLLLNNPNLRGVVNADRGGIVNEEEMARFLQAQESKSVQQRALYFLDEIPTHEVLKEHAIYLDHTGGSVKEAAQGVRIATDAVLENLIQRSELRTQKLLAGSLKREEEKEPVFNEKLFEDPTIKIALANYYLARGSAGNSEAAQRLVEIFNNKQNSLIVRLIAAPYLKTQMAKGEKEGTFVEIYPEAKDFVDQIYAREDAAETLQNLGAITGEFAQRLPSNLKEKLVYLQETATQSTEQFWVQFNMDEPNSISGTKTFQMTTSVPGTVVSEGVSAVEEYIRSQGNYLLPFKPTIKILGHAPPRLAPKAEIKITPDFAQRFVSNLRYVSLISLPGAGKGTLMKRFLADLKRHLPPEEQVNYLEMGDWFRGVDRLIKKEAKPGDEQKYGSVASMVPEEDQNRMRNSELVSDKTALNLLNAILDRQNGAIIFDGFPRTPKQVKALKEKQVLHHKKSVSMDLYIVLEVSEEIALQRMQKRAAEESDRPDNGNLAGRIQTAIKNTMPLLEDIPSEETITLNANHSADEVYQEFLIKLDQKISFLEATGSRFPELRARRSETRIIAKREDDAGEAAIEASYVRWIKQNLVQSAKGKWVSDEELARLINGITPQDGWFLKMLEQIEDRSNAGTKMIGPDGIASYGVIRYQNHTALLSSDDTLALFSFLRDVMGNIRKSGSNGEETNQKFSKTLNETQIKALGELPKFPKLLKALTELKFLSSEFVFRNRSYFSAEFGDAGQKFFETLFSQVANDRPVFILRKSAPGKRPLSLYFDEIADLVGEWKSEWTQEGQHILFPRWNSKQGYGLWDEKARVFQYHPERIPASIKPEASNGSSAAGQARAESRSELQKTGLTEQQALTVAAVIQYLSGLGIPGAGKESIMKRFLTEFNQLLPPDKQYAYFEMGAWFRGVTGISKNLKGVIKPEERNYFDIYSKVSKQYPGIIEAANIEMKAGRLVPNSTTIIIINEVLQLPQYQNAYGIIFDGIPRNLVQLQWITDRKILVGVKQQPLVMNAYVTIEVTEKVARERIEARRQKTITEGKDPREDDHPDKVDERMIDARKNTVPLMNSVRTLLNAIKVDGENDQETVYDEFIEKIVAHAQTLLSRRSDAPELIPDSLSKQKERRSETRDDVEWAKAAQDTETLAVQNIEELKKVAKALADAGKTLGILGKFNPQNPQFPLTVEALDREIIAGPKLIDDIYRLYERQSRAWHLNDHGDFEQFVRIHEDGKTVVYAVYVAGEKDPMLYEGDIPLEVLQNSEIIFIQNIMRAKRPGRPGSGETTSKTEGEEIKRQEALEKKDLMQKLRPDHIVNHPSQLRLRWKGPSKDDEWWFIMNPFAILPSNPEKKANQQPLSMTFSRADKAVLQKEFIQFENIGAGLVAASHANKINVAPSELQALARLIETALGKVTEKGNSFNILVAPLTEPQGQPLGMRFAGNGWFYSTKPNSPKAGASQAYVHWQPIVTLYPVEHAVSKPQGKKNGVQISTLDDGKGSGLILEQHGLKVFIYDRPIGTPEPYFTNEWAFSELSRQVVVDSPATFYQLTDEQKNDLDTPDVIKDVAGWTRQERNAQRLSTIVPHLYENALRALKLSTAKNEEMEDLAQYLLRSEVRIEPLLEALKNHSDSGKSEIPVLKRLVRLLAKKQDSALIQKSLVTLKELISKVPSQTEHTEPVADNRFGSHDVTYYEPVPFHGALEKAINDLGWLHQRGTLPPRDYKKLIKEFLINVVAIVIVIGMVGFIPLLWASIFYMMLQERPVEMHREPFDKAPAMIIKNEASGTLAQSSARAEARENIKFNFSTDKNSSYRKLSLTKEPLENRRESIRDSIDAILKEESGVKPQKNSLLFILRLVRNEDAGVQKSLIRLAVGLIRERLSDLDQGLAKTSEKSDREKIGHAIARLLAVQDELEDIPTALQNSLKQIRNERSELRAKYIQTAGVDAVAMVKTFGKWKPIQEEVQKFADSATQSTVQRQINFIVNELVRQKISPDSILANKIPFLIKILNQRQLELVLDFAYSALQRNINIFPMIVSTFQSYHQNFQGQDFQFILNRIIFLMENATELANSQNRVEDKQGGLFAAIRSVTGKPLTLDEFKLGLTFAVKMAKEGIRPVRALYAIPAIAKISKDLNEYKTNLVRFQRTAEQISVIENIEAAHAVFQVHLPVFANHFEGDNFKFRVYLNHWIHFLDSLEGLIPAIWESLLKEKFLQDLLRVSPDSFSFKENLEAVKNFLSNVENKEMLVSGALLSALENSVRNARPHAGEEFRKLLKKEQDFVAFLRNAKFNADLILKSSELSKIIREAATSESLTRTWERLKTILTEISPKSDDWFKKALPLWMVHVQRDDAIYSLILPWLKEMRKKYPYVENEVKLLNTFSELLPFSPTPQDLQANLQLGLELSKSAGSDSGSATNETLMHLAIPVLAKISGDNPVKFTQYAALTKQLISSSQWRSQDVFRSGFKALDRYDLKEIGQDFEPVPLIFKMFPVNGPNADLNKVSSLGLLDLIKEARRVRREGLDYRIEVSPEEGHLQDSGPPQTELYSHTMYQPTIYVMDSPQRIVLQLKRSEIREIEESDASPFQVQVKLQPEKGFKGFSITAYIQVASNGHDGENGRESHFQIVKQNIPFGYTEEQISKRVTGVLSRNGNFLLNGNVEHEIQEIEFSVDSDTRAAFANRIQQILSESLLSQFFKYSYQFNFQLLPSDFEPSKLEEKAYKKNRFIPRESYRVATTKGKPGYRFNFDVAPDVEILKLLKAAEVEVAHNEKVDRSSVDLESSFYTSRAEVRAKKSKKPVTEEKVEEVIGLNSTREKRKAFMRPLLEELENLRTDLVALKTKHEGYSTNSMWWNEEWVTRIEDLLQKAQGVKASLLTTNDSREVKKFFNSIPEFKLRLDVAIQYIREYGEKKSLHSFYEPVKDFVFALKSHINKWIDDIFEGALELTKAPVGRTFTFGPVEFTYLGNDEDGEPIYRIKSRSRSEVRSLKFLTFLGISLSAFIYLGSEMARSEVRNSGEVKWVRLAVREYDDVVSMSDPGSYRNSSYGSLGWVIEGSEEYHKLIQSAYQGAGSDYVLNSEYEIVVEETQFLKEGETPQTPRSEIRDIVLIVIGGGAALWGLGALIGFYIQKIYYPVDSILEDLDQFAGFSYNFNFVGSRRNRDIVDSLVKLGRPAVPQLIEKLQDQDARVRFLVVHALGEIGDSKASFAAILRLVNDPQREISSAASDIIRKYKDPVILDDLIEGLSSPSPKIVAASAGLLAKFQDPRIVPYLIKTLSHENLEVISEVANSLGALKDKKAVDPLIEKFSELIAMPPPDKRGLFNYQRALSEIISSLGYLGDPRAIPLIQKVSFPANVGKRLKVLGASSETIDAYYTKTFQDLHPDSFDLIALSAIIEEIRSYVSPENAIALLLKIFEGTLKRMRHPFILEKIILAIKAINEKDASVIPVLMPFIGLKELKLEDYMRKLGVSDEMIIAQYRGIFEAGENVSESEKSHSAIRLAELKDPKAVPLLTKELERTSLDATGTILFLVNVLKTMGDPQAIPAIQSVADRLPYTVLEEFQRDTGERKGYVNDLSYDDGIIYETVREEVPNPVRERLLDAIEQLERSEARGPEVLIWIIAGGVAVGAAGALFEYINRNRQVSTQARLDKEVKAGNLVLWERIVVKGSISHGESRETGTVDSTEEFYDDLGWAIVGSEKHSELLKAASNISFPNSQIDTSEKRYMKPDESPDPNLKRWVRLVLRGHEQIPSRSPELGNDYGEIYYDLGWVRYGSDEYFKLMRSDPFKEQKGNPAEHHMIEIQTDVVIDETQWLEDGKLPRSEERKGYGINQKNKTARQVSLTGGFEELRTKLTPDETIQQLNKAVNREENARRAWESNPFPLSGTQGVNSVRILTRYHPPPLQLLRSESRSQADAKEKMKYHFKWAISNALMGTSRLTSRHAIRMSEKRIYLIYDFDPADTKKGTILETLKFPDDIQPLITRMLRKIRVHRGQEAFKSVDLVFADSMNADRLGIRLGNLLMAILSSFEIGQEPPLGNTFSRKLINGDFSHYTFYLARSEARLEEDKLPEQAQKLFEIASQRGYRANQFLGWIRKVLTKGAVPENPEDQHAIGYLKYLFSKNMTLMTLVAKYNANYSDEARKTTLTEEFLDMITNAEKGDILPPDSLKRFESIIPEKDLPQVLEPFGYELIKIGSFGTQQWIRSKKIEPERSEARNQEQALELALRQAAPFGLPAVVTRFIQEGNFVNALVGLSKAIQQRGGIHATQPESAPAPQVSVKVSKRSEVREIAPAAVLSSEEAPFSLAANQTDWILPRLWRDSREIFAAVVRELLSRPAFAETGFAIVTTPERIVAVNNTVTPDIRVTMKQIQAAFHSIGLSNVSPNVDIVVVGSRLAIEHQLLEVLQAMYPNRLVILAASKDDEKWLSAFNERVLRARNQPEIPVTQNPAAIRKLVASRFSQNPEARKNSRVLGLFSNEEISANAARLREIVQELHTFNRSESRKFAQAAGLAGLLRQFANDAKFLASA